MIADSPGLHWDSSHSGEGQSQISKASSNRGQHSCCKDSKGNQGQFSHGQRRSELDLLCPHYWGQFSQKGAAEVACEG